MSVKSVISFSGMELTETGTKSLTCSKKYIRKILQLSVINIVYNRIDLPADEFEEDRLRDIKLMVCKKSSKHPLIYMFYEWMKGANHALERDCLKEFYLLFKNKDGALVEYYKFSFFYNFNGVDEDRVDQEVVYKQTKQIFDDIKCLSKHKKWNENNIFTAQIKYNDNVSPSYQPPYFVNNCSDVDEDHQAIKRMEQSTKLFKLPNITTGFHTLKCLFGGDNIFVNKAPSSNASSPKSIVTTEKQYHEEPVTLVSHSIISSPASSSRTEDVVEINTSSASVFCMCQSTVSHKALQIIHCTSCNKPFHCVCFGFLGVAPKQFRCVTCGGSANIPETVIDKEDAKLLIIRLRLLIGFCNLTMQLPDKIMRDFSNVQERNEMWKNLERLECIERKNETYFVNRVKVTDSTLLRQLFCKWNNPDSAEMVDLTEEDQETGHVAKKLKF